MRRATFMAIIWAAIGLAALELVTDVAAHAVDLRRATTGAVAEQDVSPWSDVWVDLLDLPVFVALASLLASRLSAATSKPLRDLTHAIRSLEGARFGRYVTVPHGDHELADLARSFNAMQTALQETFERERAFARYAAHELRTPLAAMRIQIERATLGLAPAADVVPSLERHVVRTTELLDALEAFGLATETPGEPRAAHVLIDEAVDAAHVARGARATIAVAPTPHLVKHARLVQQIVQNLVDNAWVHGEEPVTVSAHARGERLEVVVRDGGTGVTSPTSDEKVRSGGGADAARRGLGLAMVTSVTRALGGTFDAVQVDGGFEARVSLPVVVALGIDPTGEGVGGAAGEVRVEATTRDGVEADR